LLKVFTLLLYQTEIARDQEPTYWRKSAFEYILLIFFAVGALLLLPSMVASWGSNSVYALIVEGEILFFAALLLVLRQISFSVRTTGFLLLFYFLGVALLLFFGQWEAGLLLMFAFPVMATILQGVSASLVGIALNAVTLATAFVLLPALTPENNIVTTHFAQNGLVAWINFLSLNLVLTLSVALIVASMEKSLRKEKRARRAKSEETLELRKVNAELDRFVYSASHELRAPLTSLLGLVSLARLDQPGAGQLAYLQMMEQSVHRLDKFIGDIVHYSRNARLEVALVPVEMGKLIEEVFQDLSYLEGVTHIRRVVTLGQEVVHTDPTRLKVLLNNLLSNAIKYHNLSQADPYILVEVSTTDQNVLIRVTDNGSGIEPEHQQKVFQMFYRASEQANGSGLGLYIVQETLHKLGGSITLSSPFTIYLPNPA
jgi:signal transduction histidine kinase